MAAIPFIVPDAEGSIQAPMDTAAAYIELGVPILPLCGPKHRCPSPGKVPVDLQTGRHLTGWQARAVRTLDELDELLSLHLARRANIGGLMGAVSGLVAVDVDGPDGEQALQELSGGALPPTWEYGTSPGRRRLIYALPAGVTIPSRKLGAQLDLLGDGRQAVLPPSLHPSGHRYQWLPGRDPWTFGPAAPAPEWLLRLSTRPTGERTPPEEWRRITAVGVAEGERNVTLARLVGHLLRRRVDPYVVAELALCWNASRCRPPLPESEVLRTVDSVARAEARRRGVLVNA